MSLPWFIVAVAILLFLLLVGAILYLIYLKRRHSRALSELTIELAEEYKERLRSALRGQKAKVFGDDLAKLTPFFPEYPYNLRDVVPVFSTCDYIVLVGKVSGEVTEVVFQEMKTGKGVLVREQPSLRDCIKQGKVRWETWHFDEAKGCWVCQD